MTSGAEVMQPIHERKMSTPGHGTPSGGDRQSPRSGAASPCPAASSPFSVVSSTSPPTALPSLPLAPALPQEEWVELIDPQNDHVFFANPSTGECAWECPPNVVLKPKDPKGEWWELYDEQHKRPYYYNTMTKKTDWIRPTNGTIISLTAIQAALSKLSLQHSPSHQDIQQRPVEAASTPAADLSALQHKMEHMNVSPQKHPHSPSKKEDGEWSDEEDETAASGVVQGGEPETPFEAVSPTPSLSPHTAASPISQQQHVEYGTNGTPFLAEPKVISTPIVHHIDPALLDARKARSKQEPSERARDMSPRSEWTSLSRPSSLPQQLKEEINKFAIDGFATKYFATHKKGIFIRKKVPVEVMIVWTDEALESPLMVLNKKFHKTALKSFKQIQRVMGDRPFANARGGKANGTEEIHFLLDQCINQGELRDEIYVQVCKQLTKNPHPESVMKGWELMAVLCNTFPPSKNFEEYLKNFILKAASQATGAATDDAKRITVMTKYCATKLNRICKIGPRGKTPSFAEIERAREAPFYPSVFGESLEEIMKQDLAVEPGRKIPRILSFLTDAILTLNGTKTEGIFRIPGDAEGISELKLRLERGSYDLKGIRDPNVPASLLKAWLRELVDPLIPAEFYDAAIAAFEDPVEAVRIVTRLPRYHQEVVKYMVGFLQIIADPEYQASTKMTINNLAMVFAPNFLRCPSDNPQVIFTNTRFEQGFLRTLLLHYKRR